LRCAPEHLLRRFTLHAKTPARRATALELGILLL
jgi:hypothetical protein